VNFDFTEVQHSWRAKATALGLDVAGDPAAATVIMGAARSGLLDPQADLLSVAAATEALAFESPAAATAFALHSGVALTVGGDERFSSLFRGEAVAAVGLSSDDLPIQEDGHVSGRAPWVAPITDRGIAAIGPQKGEQRAAVVIALDAPGVSIETIRTAALSGLVCGHVTMARAACTAIGPTRPIMIYVRILMAAAGLGMGRRALHEALTTARASKSAAAGEQTVQGLLADAATDLEAAALLTWKAALAATPSLADASLAKLTATGAVQRAVERATQIVGADSFRLGHILERLAQDVRALELFAGRTEALRAAAAEELLPRA
jgi:alkylation response protein AidB-like acyl-CoA dehydrogenase